MLGPFAGHRFVPTGGIGLEALTTWFEAGAHAVALGSELAGRTGAPSQVDLVGVRDKARAAVDLAGSSA